MKLRLLLLFTICGIFLAGSKSVKTKDVHDVLNNDHLGDHDKHEQEEQKIIKNRVSKAKTAPIYSCSVQQSLGQCREYPIPDDITYKIAQLRESCQSLPEGRFSKGRCPKLNRIGSCSNILRNYHDPKSLIYNNHYYRSVKTWSNDKLSRVCEDLEGQLNLN